MKKLLIGISCVAFSVSGALAMLPEEKKSSVFYSIPSRLQKIDLKESIESGGMVHDVTVDVTFLPTVKVFKIKVTADDENYISAFHEFLLGLGCKQKSSQKVERKIQKQLEREARERSIRHEKHRRLQLIRHEKYRRRCLYEVPADNECESHWDLVIRMEMLKKAGMWEGDSD